MKYDDENVLLDGLRNGDEMAFTFLVDRFNHRLFGYALTLTNDYSMAEDILQNVFLMIWKKRKKLNIKSSLQNYLLKSVYNDFVNQYKKNCSNMELDRRYLEGLDKVVQIHEDGGLDKAMAVIMNEIQNLPPKCREVFILSRRDGLTNIEIADYLNISNKTVEAQITKSFKIIRNKVGVKLKTVLFFLMGLNLKNRTNCSI
tara:strand:- start:29699 stop:30301 length:603 start_codon:yes stop_codon:yes gene_type:complete